MIVTKTIENPHHLKTEVRIKSKIGERISYPKSQGTTGSGATYLFTDNEKKILTAQANKSLPQVS